MESLIQLIVGAFLLESIVETIKLLFEDGQFNKTKAGSVLLSIGFCLLYKFDLLKSLGFDSGIAAVGMVLTGILFSRGSNFIHDILDAVYDIKDR